MKAIVIYDLTGRIYHIIYGEDMLPQGIDTSMFVDIPENAQLVRIDLTNPDDPQPVFDYVPESDIGRLQKEIRDIQRRLEPEFDPELASLPQVQNYKQEQNKAALANFLAACPLTWTDGRQYGVTQTDQQEMALDLQAYQVMKQVDPGWKLEWHDIHKACHEFQPEEYNALLAAIIRFVYPYRRLQETYKEQIYTAKSKEEVLAIQLDYLPPAEDPEAEAGSDS